MNSNSYQLSCPVCGKRFSDTYLLNCPNRCQSLLRTEYNEQQLRIRDLPGLFRYSDWLPVQGYLNTDSSPICYKSRKLAHELGVSNLFIGFSGYWPERDAAVTTCSFKEFEAFPTVVRLQDRIGKGVILVSSAGNTGRAFAQVSAETGQPVILVIPKRSVDRIWTTIPTDYLLLISVDGDYSDAIRLGNELCSIPNVIPEGGAKNVARRDGMGTVMLEAAITMKRVPDWYVQGVGSGTGGIASFEASRRLIMDGRFGHKLPRMYLVQNKSFSPMVSAWNAQKREINVEDSKETADMISSVYADVLTNRAPPYGIPGGVYDAMTDTGGFMDAVDNSDAIRAGDLFLEYEGIDIDPAAAVALAGLMKGIDRGVFGLEEYILLNITGGGYQRIGEERDLLIQTPAFEVSKSDSIVDIQAAVKSMINTWIP